MRRTKSYKCILVDVNSGISTTDFKIKDYKDIARLLKCEYIECVTRNIGGIFVDIYCDEEALLKDGIKEPSIVTTGDSKILEVIYGNALLCWHNRDGFMKSLSSNAIDKIMTSKRIVNTNNKNYLVLQSTLA